MTLTKTKRRYGKQTKKTKAEHLFSQLPPSPLPPRNATHDLTNHETDELACLDDQIKSLSSRLSVTHLEEEPTRRQSTRLAQRRSSASPTQDHKDPEPALQQVSELDKPSVQLNGAVDLSEQANTPESTQVPPADSNSSPSELDTTLRPEIEEKQEDPPNEPEPVLTWNEICHTGARIVKIAEASFAEVYKVTNNLGNSILKVIRLPSPIKAKTKAQIRCGLVDEEPHSIEAVKDELQISDMLSYIPGFVVYKKTYIVQGKTTKMLLETHQMYAKKVKKNDPGLAQFYPSPSRYLDDTKFMVIELGDAGVSLEDWELTDSGEIFDIFFLVALALGRAEDAVRFEHRDLHEGNLCIRRVRQPTKRDGKKAVHEFCDSGLDITILDYGLSRAEHWDNDAPVPIALDLEMDLSYFTSTHAESCEVYRRMRSYMLRGDRICLPPDKHDKPYEKGVAGRIDWKQFTPYTNVLWLAYLYRYMVEHFKGSDEDLAAFRSRTADLWKHLNPEAPKNVESFESAYDIVDFAIECQWIKMEQLNDMLETFHEPEDSILSPDDSGK